MPAGISMLTVLLKPKSVGLIVNVGPEMDTLVFVTSMDWVCIPFSLIIIIPAPFWMASLKVKEILAVTATFKALSSGLREEITGFVTSTVATVPINSISKLMSELELFLWWISTAIVLLPVVKKDFWMVVVSQVLPSSATLELAAVVLEIVPVGMLFL